MALDQRSAVVGGVAGALVTAAVAWYINRRKSDEGEALSTTSSGHSGSVYETSKAVAEYLMFHFGSPTDILPYEDGPHNALNFASR